MKKPTTADRQEQARHALNCAIGCLVAWPPSSEHLGGAVYFTALALHRLAQADTSGEAGRHAEQILQHARQTSAITIGAVKGDPT